MGEFVHAAELAAREIWVIRERLFEAIHRPIHDRKELELIMSALDDAIGNLTTAVAADTEATNTLITALAAGEPTEAQLTAIAAQASAVEANTTAINTALGLNEEPAPAEPAPEPEVQS